MNQTQADNCLTLAHLLKKKYTKWDFNEPQHCAIGIAERNYELFGIQTMRHFSERRLFGIRVSDVFFGSEIDKNHKDITQKDVRNVVLDIVDQEGWEEV